jgi:hypothetical protein
MPKVAYTPSKGLVQSAGSGFDVSSVIRGAKKQIIATTTTLSLADSGAVLAPRLAAAQTFTLPAVATAAGFHVTFHAGSPQVHVINGGGAKMQGAVYHATAGSTLARQAVTNRSSITLSGAEVGDYFTIIGDGTNYYVFGWCEDEVTLA